MMNRRNFNKQLSILASGLVLPTFSLQAKVYLSLEQAQKLLWGEEGMSKLDLVLTKVQMKSIRSSSKVRVRHPVMNIWRTDSAGWFILDQIIGKHENIDMAFAFSEDGKVKGMEILQYRETYGFEVQNENWRAQFNGKDSSEVLKLGKQVKNISGATLSCRHITDGVNRLAHTWEQVLQYL